jgi:hypothetical protein
MRIALKRMLWLGHFVTTRACFGSLSLEEAVWSIAPDLPMTLFLTPWTNTWGEIKDWKIYDWFYKLPHSMWSLILIRNSRARNIYAFHILMDILSHTGQWSIEPFFPVGPVIHGVWNPVEWI